jgi:putative oxidoreductase
MRAGHALARAMLAAPFVHGGAATLRDPAPRARAAAPFLSALRAAVPCLPGDAALVKANAAVQVAAGIALAAGAGEPLAAWLLATSLAPTTVAGHPFWTADDPGELIQFGKNAGILGGLLLLAFPPADRSRLRMVAGQERGNSRHGREPTGH